MPRMQTSDDNDELNSLRFVKVSSMLWLERAADPHRQHFRFISLARWRMPILRCREKFAFHPNRLPIRILSDAISAVTLPIAASSVPDPGIVAGEFEMQNLFLVVLGKYYRSWRKIEIGIIHLDARIDNSMSKADDPCVPKRCDIIFETLD